MAKKYALFVGYAYYPNGGWKDLFGVFDTLKEAQAHVPEDQDFMWWHIVDLDKLTIVDDIEED
jgi:hypothetical protein